MSYCAWEESRQDCCKDYILQFVYVVVDAEEILGVAADGLEVNIGCAGSLVASHHVSVL